MFACIFIPDFSVQAIIRFEPELRARPVAVLTGPYPCPADCIFCPDVKGYPRSYLPDEPAVQRAKRARFNSRLPASKNPRRLATPVNGSVKEARR